MTEISEYMSNQDEIVRLNKQIDMIAGFYKSLYEAKAKKLNRTVKRLIDGKSKVKRKFEKLKSDKPTISKTRTLKAINLLKISKSNSGGLTVPEISKQCFLGPGYVYNLSRKINSGDL